MSGVAEGTKMLAAAHDVDAQAAQFLIKSRNQAGWNTNDQREFDLWLSQSIAHEAAYWRLEAIWDRADRLSALRPASPSDNPARLTLRNRLRALPVAAAFAAIVAVGIAADVLLYSPRVVTYSTPVGGHLAVKLADGSRVELNTDTVLQARTAGQERSVVLEKGEAYFHIRHDRVHPFFVMVSGHRIVDLGTEFLVRRNADRVEVALVEGRARIETESPSLQPHAMELRPGDFAVATAKTISISKKATLDLADQLGWRHGVLVFHHVALADAAAEFNRYNNQKIVVVGPSIARLEIVGTFPVTDTDLFGRAVRTVLGLNVERRGEEILISR